MAPQIINNPVTGQQLTFLQTSATTNGQLLEMESRFRAHSKEPVPHYHPIQQENFKVLQGQIKVRINNEVKTLNAGDELFIAPKVVHSMWNGGNDEAVVNWKIEPALQSEQLFRTAFGLANDGKTNPDGAPDLLQASLLVSHHFNEYRLAKPPFVVQRIVFGVLKPIARLMGYKAVYDQYLSAPEV
jgi:quercetin dioxygenase-like cupin family protein